MQKKVNSPKITDIEWGEITVDNKKTYKDAKLYPGGSCSWDWNETGTHHVPGIQRADVRELIDQGSKTIVLSRGFHERLQVCRETLDLLKQKNITHHVLKTGQAVDKYNELHASIPVGALIHSTC